MTLDQFIAEHGQRLVALAYMVTNDLGSAEDAVQTALARMSRRWDRISDPVPYARRAVVNACHDQRRRGARETSTDPHTLAAVSEMRAPSGDHHVAADHYALHEAIADLPERQRVILVVKYFEGLSDPEIAAVLGVRASTVRSTTARAREAIRARVEHRYQDSAEEGTHAV